MALRDLTGQVLVIGYAKIDDARSLEFGFWNSDCGLKNQKDGCMIHDARFRVFRFWNAD